MNTSSRSTLYAIFALSSLAACAPIEADISETDDHQESLRSGSLVTAETINQLGLVDIGTWCSGVVYNAEWVITAAHCVNAASPTSVPLRWGTQSRTSDRIEPIVGADIALVHASTSFNISGTFLATAPTQTVLASVPRALHRGAITSLVGTAMTCYGRGFESTTAETTGVTDGLWRSGILTVSSVFAAGPFIGYAANSLGQIQRPGDSGGPCFITQGGVTAVVGINRNAGYQCGDTACTVQNGSAFWGDQTAVSSFATEIERIAARGIRVSTATYGANCGAPAGNATAALSSACRYRSASCAYTVRRESLGDHAPGCAKDFRASWACSGGARQRSLTLPGEAGLGSVASLSCAGITVLSATYGNNLLGTAAAPNVRFGNASQDVATACDGRASCDYSVSFARLGDQAPGLGKDFVVRFVCNGAATPREVRLAAEAGWGSVAALRCP